jgi:hypothetical protein
MIGTGHRKTAIEQPDPESAQGSEPYRAVAWNGIVEAILCVHRFQIFARSGKRCDCYNDRKHNGFPRRRTTVARRPHGSITVIFAGVMLPMPRTAGRYMSSTSGGGTVYVPGVTARTR